MQPVYRWFQLRAVLGWTVVVQSLSPLVSTKEMLPPKALAAGSQIDDCSREGAGRSVGCGANWGHLVIEYLTVQTDLQTEQHSKPWGTV